MRIHIFGASGSGVSALGKSLADKLGVDWFDADDFYWKKTDPPYREAVPITERMKRLDETLRDYSDWVLSGSILSWGDKIKDSFDASIYLFVPPEERILRLKMRETQQFGERY